MPFTPFHMGPGIMIKAVLQGSFSLMVFGWAQIIMDIQPLLVLMTGEGELHGFTHTYVGATLLAVLSALTGKYLSEWGLLVIRISSQTNPVKIAWWVVFLSAFIGTYTHVALDSILYLDIDPLFPLELKNGLLGLINPETLYRLCVISGVVGAVVYYAVHFMLKRKGPS